MNYPIADYTAREYQLFTDEPGVDTCATDINTWLNAEVAVRAEKIASEYGNDRNLNGLVRDAYIAVTTKIKDNDYWRYGAGDTEPESVIYWHLCHTVRVLTGDKRWQGEGR